MGGDPLFSSLISGRDAGRNALDYSCAVPYHVYGHGARTTLFFVPAWGPLRTGSNFGAKFRMLRHQYGQES